MTTKYTTGPWIKMDCLNSFVIYGPNGYIAELARFTDKDNTENNAQIIASAPELLDCLNTIYANWGLWLPEDIAGKLAKVIAKAEGRE